MMKTYKTIWCLLLSFISSYALYAQNEASIRNSKETLAEISNLTYLQATIGSGEYCLGEAVIVPIEVNNFIGAAAFQLKFSYNTDILSCEGFGNVNPELGSMSATVDQLNGILTLNWQGTATVTFSGQVTVCDLLFTPKQTGFAQLNWFTGSTESYFIDSDGAPIPAEFYSGIVQIIDPPEILLAPSKIVCVGEEVTIKGVVTSTNPPVTYQWTWPDGHMTNTDPFFASITQEDAGDYTLLATDAKGCADQKSIHLVVSWQAIIENYACRMTVYPNPGKGLFGVHLQFPMDVNANVKVTDIAGNVVYQKADVVFPAEGRIGIDISNLADGVYFLTVSTKDRVLQEKLILRHH